MVCHESYKDEKGNWLYPEEVEKITSSEAVKKDDKTKVRIGKPESMSKSKKNTIDPEQMISHYGADAVRWFIMSDSPPEKDIKWSDTGVSSANKFLQKIWNLNYTISNRKELTSNSKIEKEFITKMDAYIFRVDSSINAFRFNVSIAHFYEIYKVFNKYLNQSLSSKILTAYMIKVMKLMIPFVPHLAYESLEVLNCRDINNWPKIVKKLDLEKVKIIIQINGKTRDVIDVKKDLLEQDIYKITMKSSKAEKFLKNKKIDKTIFVKNKIINYLINS